MKKEALVVLSVLSLVAALPAGAAEPSDNNTATTTQEVVKQPEAATESAAKADAQKSETATDAATTENGQVAPTNDAKKAPQK